MQRMLTKHPPCPTNTSHHEKVDHHQLAKRSRSQSTLQGEPRRFTRQPGPGHPGDIINDNGR
eukprot:5839031-Pyramimonas_sp.AAC.1